MNNLLPATLLLSATFLFSSGVDPSPGASSVLPPQEHSASQPDSVHGSGAARTFQRQADTPADPLTTRAERTGWSELTSHEELLAFYEELTARSRDVRVREMGRSAEGRPLQEVVLARPPVTEPWEAHASGKPVVLISAQVHGDEPAGKEALMLFARELALGNLQELLDQVIFVLAPQLNPDGAEAGEWGIRNNLRGRNANRDYLRLEDPGIRAFVRDVVAGWRPHVIVDLHELVGPPRIYDFYTSYPRDMAGPTLNFELTRSELVPAIVAALEANGHTHFPYHRVPSGLVDDPSMGVSAGSYGAQALSSYGGAQAAVTLLYESVRARDARVGLEDRVLRHQVALEAMARFVAENHARVVATVKEERDALVERGARWDAADSIAIHLRQVPSRVEDYRLLWQGDTLRLRVPVLDSAVVEMGRVRPVAYLLEPSREEAARHLRLHGLQVVRLEVPARAAGESFRVESVERASSQYEGYVPRVFTTSLVPRELEIPAGAFLVRMDQPAARIAAFLLEPDNENSLASAGWLTTEERPGALLSIHRLKELPSPLETDPTSSLPPRGLDAGAPLPVPVHGGSSTLPTPGEASGWAKLTSHRDLVAFYRALEARSPFVQMHEIGRSRLGRPLHLVVLSRPSVKAPWEAHASGKPVVFIGAQVHGDEPAGAEGLMLLARELVEGSLQEALDEAIFLLVPQINPDGAQAGTWGSRNNALGYNLNRDYLVLHNPESRALVQEVLTPWRPHVLLDLHELGGPPRVYHFYTWSPTNPHGPWSTYQMATGNLIPAVVEALENEGYSHIIYHTAGGIAQDPTSGIAVPAYGRTLNDYAGAQGMASVLFESLRERDARVGIQDRARRHQVGLEAVVREVVARPQAVVQAAREARREMHFRGSQWDPADSIAILREPAVSQTIQYRVAEMERVETESGARWQPTGEIITVETPLYDSARVVLGRIRPMGYLIESHRGDLVEELLAHGIVVEEVLREGSWEVESFRVDSLAIARTPYEGYVPQRFKTTLEARILTVPKGSYLVRANQPGAALVFHLLEPEDENSFAITGAFLSEARRGAYLPVHRVKELPQIPLRIVGGRGDG
jgi:murein tripeptide amidase MpaA